MEDYRLDQSGQEVQDILNGAAMQSDLTAENERAEQAEQTLDGKIDDEEARAKAAEKQNADDIDAIEEKIPSGASSSNKLATESEITTLSAAIEAILALIPSAATALNQLADKAFVNSSIDTATAVFRGTFNLVSDLHLALDATHAQIGAALLNAVPTADNNDYVFVQVPTSAGTPTEIRVTERYKFNGESWSYEYDLNNSGFTASQWEAINSAITSALVTKLSALPTASELTTLFAGKQNVLTFDDVPVNGSNNPVKSDGLYDLFTAIDAKFPSDASSSNKLVAENRLASYVAGIIGALDASFDLTSTDGHVTFKMTQADGVITSVQILTSDIASAQALTTLGGQVSTNASDIAALQDLYNALQQSAPEIIQPSDTWPVANPSTTVIYRVIDRVNTPPEYYSDYMFKASDLTTPVLMATYNNAIDPRPKKGSANLVTSGGVFDNMGALDVSELNATEGPHTIATYADLSAALAAIPSDYQKGGMSIKFVSSVDNKYVQYRLMSASWSTTVSEWQGVDDEPVAGSANLVKSGGVAAKFSSIDAILDGFSVTEEQVTPIVDWAPEGKSSGYYDKNNTWNNDENINTTRIDVQGCSKVRFLGIVRRSAGAGLSSLGFFFQDANGQRTSEGFIKYDVDGTVSAIIVTREYVIDVPADAKYFYVPYIITTYIGTGDFYCYVAQSDTVKGSIDALENQLEEEIANVGFGSGQKVEETNIDNNCDGSVIPVSENNVASAKAVALVKQALTGFNFQETALSPFEEFTPAEKTSGYYKKSDGSWVENSDFKTTKIDISGSHDKVRFLGIEQRSAPNLCYFFADSNSELIGSMIGFDRNSDMSAYYRTKEYIINIPDGAVYLFTLYKVGTILTTDNFYCYAQDGETISEAIDEAIDEAMSTGTGILDFNPEKEVLPVMRNLKHRLRNASYVQQAKQLVLLHLSDQHADATHLERALEFYNHYSSYIDDVIHTGDIVADKWQDGIEWLNEVDGAENVLQAIGNHDVNVKAGKDGRVYTDPNDLSQYIETSGNVEMNRSNRTTLGYMNDNNEIVWVTYDDVYGRYISPYVSNWGVTQPDDAATNKLNYYYKDYTDQGIRLIVLDCMAYTTDQNNWLISVLASAKTLGYGVIIAEHYPISLNGFEGCAFTSSGRKVTDDFYEGMGNNSTLADAQLAVDNFMDNGGEFICWIAGHTHIDNCGTLANYSKQVMFVTDCTGLTGKSWSDSERVAGDKTEDTFTLISVDRFKKIVRFYRVGNHWDRYGRHKVSMAIDYRAAKMIYSS